jgi:nitroimidazol reductase NimA-like FMN-containing flavoprotein (pyridoxamine 5'-phosphate oxidase superfamily)
MMNDDHEAIARAIIDASQYLTVATADQDGLPWASPLWFAASGYEEFFWVSDPAARHSRNIAVRPQVSLVIFDSHAPIGIGQGVYIAATATELTGDEMERGVQIFSEASQRQGGRPWGTGDVLAPAKHRLYRATALEQYIGDRNDERVRLRPLSAARPPSAS